MYTTTTDRATCSDPPRYFIETKRGFRPYNDKPGGDVPFAVVHRGRWCLVYRAQDDAEYFADHPEAAWRFTTCRKPWHARDYYEFQITTRDGTLESTGDRWDVEGALSRALLDARTNPDRFGGESPLQRLRRAVNYLLADENRTCPVEAA